MGFWGSDAEDPRIRIATKTADESRNNTIVLADDADLQFPVVADHIYCFMTDIIFICGNSVPDILFTYTVPAGDTRTGFQRVGVHGVNNIAWGVGINENGANNERSIFNEGILAPTADGDFIFQWAQRVSDGANTTVLRGSMIIIIDVTP